eukprot:CAMPEP_0184306916 /NCGR_PEP_ID=MMETSP1049-20130417/15790_1 /TAXON_ID=77928 /ORGANISM="Proteomonas sulcata, Strain CCMP704" /LENGTH=79 /DNA_ID=CAMNT_0026619285 /DNA_START=1196 /DNA_END=1435 /DNA_ORIENTATION=+
MANQHGPSGEAADNSATCRVTLIFGITVAPLQLPPQSKNLMAWFPESAINAPVPSGSRASPFGVRNFARVESPSSYPSP